MVTTDDGVVFLNAYCVRCGEQLCRIAAPIEYSDSMIILNTGHNCKPCTCKKTAGGLVAYWSSECPRASHRQAAMKGK